MRTLLTVLSLAIAAVLAPEAHADVYAGLPYWTEGDQAEAGAVAIFAGGLSGMPVVFTQSTEGVPSVSEGDDHFGQAVARGDFDGDGFADLAIGAPGERTQAEFAPDDQGAVTVLRGSASGPTAGGAQRVFGPPSYPGAKFGWSLAAGDLNGDGFADLVVGAPNDEVAFHAGGFGSIQVFFGGRAGLDTAHPRVLHRPKQSEAGFGDHLTLGDFDGDRHLDVFENGSGMLHQSGWCPGSADGPTGCRSFGPPPTAADPVSVAAGDVTGDGRDDVVEGLANGYGQILLRRGGAHGPRAGRIIDEGRRGVPGSRETGDAFGEAVSVGDLDRDGHAEVVVGSPGEDGDAGRIVILRGNGTGVATSGARTISQRDRGVPGAKGSGHRFGSALALVRRAGERDLDLLTATGVRSLFEIPGSRDGLVTHGTTGFDLRRRLGHRPPDDGTTDVAIAGRR